MSMLSLGFIGLLVALGLLFIRGFKHSKNAILLFWRPWIFLISILLVSYFILESLLQSYFASDPRGNISRALSIRNLYFSLCYNLLVGGVISSILMARRETKGGGLMGTRHLDSSVDQ